MVLAHSKNDLGVEHDLVSHLKEVARLAAQFAAKFGAADLAYWAGLWHDLGKFHPDFQAYLQNPHAPRGPDHKGAGTSLAAAIFDPLAFLVQGHHGGLSSRAELKPWVKSRSSAPCTQEALNLARQELPGLETATHLAFPPFVRSESEAEFFVRMLFSSLVDADFLDTEAHFSPEASRARRVFPPLDTLWHVFEADQLRVTGHLTDPVNRLRHQVYKDCLEAAGQAAGFFRLTVPTGGGKTRSALAFGLRHGLSHGMDRIIVGIPYTSIIEQTADIYREILGSDAVLEHHSALPANESAENPSPPELWRRVASENWDAAVVVTTTVQLFESLFANSTSRCRKLHNIAKSVLILDEVQTLPTRLLQPILDVLRQLVGHYGATVVLCTATQPALQESTYLKGLSDVREIAPDPERLFKDLQRVTYDYSRAKRGERMTWEEVAAEMREQRQALAVLNTKKDALALLDALDDRDALHLSTLMCGAHRRHVLRHVIERLRTDAPCRLVSTQVVEAGVDLDFPVVLRAIGPLDRIVQAAGRCNREGRLHPQCARVLIFDPQEPAPLPPGEYQSATATTQALLGLPDFDLHDPRVYREYFQRLYQVVELDAEGIQPLRKALDFPEVAERFRLIDDDTAPLIVRYRGPDGKDSAIDGLLVRINDRPADLTRQLLRQLQPYMVSVRSRQLAAFQKDGLIHELRAGLYEWLGQYHPVRGLAAANRDPAELVA